MQNLQPARQISCGLWVVEVDAAVVDVWIAVEAADVMVEFSAELCAETAAARAKAATVAKKRMLKAGARAKT